MQKKIVIRVQKLAHFKGVLPQYQSLGASGFDVCACLEQDVVLEPGERGLIPTGLSVAIPRGFELQARPRSGLALKQGLTLLNSPGTIDSDYRGELKIIVINHGQDVVTIKNDMRIAQMVLCPVIYGELQSVKILEETARGQGGFGSTGV